MHGAQCIFPNEFAQKKFEVLIVKVTHEQYLMSL